VPTVPGRRYALRLTGVSGGDRKFAVFFRRKDAQSYAGGQAYSAGGAAQPFDLNATVFSDSDGTAVLHNRTAVGLGELRDGFYGGRWGQTFTATAGTSLAAADVWAAGADNRWDLDFTFRVFRGAPGGAQVGPAKTTRAAFQAFGAGLHGVSYSPGEVPLEPGGLYYIEFTSSPGFNPYINDAGGDAHAGGDAYQDRSLRAGVDLSMTIIVHTEPGGALAGRVTDAATGNGIPGATVTVVEIGRSAAAAADGSYEIRDLPAGAYSVRAANGGYAAASRAGVRITVGETAVADFALAAEPCAGAFMNSSFEAGLGGWTRYGDARDRTVDTSGGGWFAGITARDGIRFHGNEINGCCLSGGLYQQACAVPGRRYLVSAWSNIYWLQGSADDATSRIGVDPGGGTDPNGPVVWSPRHRQPVSGREEWTRLEIEAQAAGPLLTVFLDFRQLPATGNQWRINCFDLVEVEDLDSEPPPPGFRRGDCDTSGDGEITDAIFLLNFLFLGGNAPGCADACDANDDGELNITDASFLLNFLFLGGPPPPPPGAGECGPDAPGPAPDLLACEAPAC
jgi:hypothetical protein